MKTYVPKAAEIRRDWWVVDAEGLVLGRLATEVATRLRGKHKPTFSPFLDSGDHVIVVNAEKVVLTGRKLDDKLYHRHSGYPGGLKSISAGKLQAAHPERLVELAVKRMLPKGPLGRQMGRKLKDDKSFTDEDAAFHLAIAEATHNKIQTHLMFSIYDLLQEKVGLCYYDDETELIYQQHCDIVEALKKGDESLALKQMEKHLSYVEKLLNRLVVEEAGSKRG